MTTEAMHGQLFPIFFHPLCILVALSLVMESSSKMAERKPGQQFNPERPPYWVDFCPYNNAVKRNEVCKCHRGASYRSDDGTLEMDDSMNEECDDDSGRNTISTTPTGSGNYMMSSFSDTSVVDATKGTVQTSLGGCDYW